MKSYYKPTPVKWRKLGDALLAVSAFLVGSQIVAGNKIWALVALGLGVIGKFLTNFFSEDPSEAKK